MNKPIRVGTYLVMKDKVVSVFLIGDTLEVNTTVGKDKLVYDTVEIAQSAYDELYNKLGEK